MSRELFHFLYVDSNYVSRNEITNRLNQNSSRLHKNYDIKITACGDYKTAIKLLLRHNYDFKYQEAAQRKNPGLKFPLFNSIIFEINSPSPRKKENWQYLIKNAQLVGYKRLKLTDGLIAFGNQTQFSPCSLETLMGLNVVKIFYKPFTIEQFESALGTYLNNLDGAYLNDDERIEKVSSNKEIIYRYIRYYDENNEIKSLPLDSLEYSSDTFITRIIDDAPDPDTEERHSTNLRDSPHSGNGERVK